MKITLHLENSDYSSIVDAVLSLINRAATDRPNSTLQMKMFPKLKKPPGKFSVAVFRALSKNRKDEMIVKMLNNYSKNIVEQFNQYLSGMYVLVTISAMYARRNGGIELSAYIKHKKIKEEF